MYKYGTKYNIHEGSGSEREKVTREDHGEREGEREGGRESKGKCNGEEDKEIKMGMEHITEGNG